MLQQISMNHRETPLARLLLPVGLLLALAANCFVFGSAQDGLLAAPPPPPAQPIDAPEVRAKKCAPVLASLGSMQLERTRQWAPIGEEARIEQQRQQAQAGRKEFVLAVSDIDMPLGLPNSGTGNPLHSAMKLLSALERHIYGETDEDNYENVSEDQDQGQTGAQDEAEAEVAKTNSIQFRQNKLHLSGLNLTMLNVHLYNQSDPRFGVGINFKNTTLKGRFFYNGPTPTLLASSGSSGAKYGRSKLNGAYRMSIDNVLVVVNANLTKISSNHLLEAPSSFNGSAHSRYQMITSDFKLNISNLGYISIDILDGQDERQQTSNYVLRMLQRVLQKTIKRIYYSFESNLIRTLELEGKQFLDCELTRFEPILQTSSAVPGSSAKWTDQATGDRVNKSTSLEDLSRIISSEIDHLNLSKIALPDFDYQRQILGTNANIFFSNGSLTGLNNFRLLGETRIKLQSQHLLINASLGWFDLRPHYNWTLYLGSNPVQRVQLAGRPDGLSATNRDDQNMPTNVERGNETSVAKVPPSTSSSPTSIGFVAFNIKAIDFDAVISKGLGPSARLSVDELTIKRLDGPKMEFSGLPGMNRLARALVNFFMGRLKQRLVGSLQPALKRELEEILNKLPLLNQI